MMNNYNQNFKAFRVSFINGNASAAIGFLGKCLMEKPKEALLELYEKNFLFNREFFSLNVESIQAPPEYKTLLRIMRDTSIRLTNVLDCFRGYSKEQLLQGAANLLEKGSAELKYNTAWNVKYAGADELFLETERQGFYFSKAGIEFEEILRNVYKDLPDEETVKINWDESVADKFRDLFHEVYLHNEIKDIIERHLFFDWTLEHVDAKTLKTNPPAGQREGKTETDYINNHKSKIAFEGLDNIAHRNLMADYLEKITRNEPKPAEFWKYVPDQNNKEDMAWWGEATFIDIGADITVQRELALIKHKYFPGFEDLKELELDNGDKLPLEETLRIIAFIGALSREYIKEIDASYTRGVNEFSRRCTMNDDTKEILRKTQELKGDKEAIKEVLGKHFNNKVNEENQRIIAGAKTMIINEHCLIRFDYERLVKTIQWLHQYEADFIKRVLNIFMFETKSETGVTRAPFFKLGGNLCWMPNMVAYASLAESLLENLVHKKLIEIHRMQTDYYERSLMKVFEKCEYKVILNKADKVYKGSEGKDKGDFDLLAYRAGHLIFMELKLSNSRNNYYERYRWKINKLDLAASQLKKGMKFIKNNPGHIKKILGLTDSERINTISPFIVSNSYLYDHEKINGFLKVSYFEVITLVLALEQARKGNPGNVSKFARLIEENRMFEQLEKEPLLYEIARVDFGEYVIMRPGMLLKNVYTAL